MGKVSQRSQCVRQPKTQRRTLCGRPRRQRTRKWKSTECSDCVALPASQGLPPGLRSPHTHPRSPPSLVSLAAMMLGGVPLLSALWPAPHPDPCPVPHLSPTTPSSCSTKQLLADIMQFHPGDSFKEMLSLSVSSSQVLYRSSPPHATSTAASFPWTPPTIYHEQTPLLTNNENAGGPRPLPLTPETHRLRRAA